ncbi:GlcG/HbpS family heme-binding protein [Streptomyces sp. BI20]|uniref:GlcG/HbpS family heme-binding protein n=1 Tax=Streptomyces sp. BI20 TaxID=3403460 RepID=UPI003C711077
MSAQIRQRPALTNELAQQVLKAAEKAAADLGQPSTIAIVDESGNLNALNRQDGAALLTVEIAQDKAYTAAGFGMPTDQWHEFIKDDQPLAMGAPTGIRRLIVFGGGLPIVVDGAVVGGVGVSGGHWSDDIKIAQAGLASLDA